MANIYVRSTDGNNADNGSTWALAKATIAGATAIAVAGDVIWVSQVHAESVAGTTNLTVQGTRANPLRIICGNDGAEPPTAVATSATATASGTGTFNYAGVVSGSIYVYGIAYTVGSGANNGTFLLSGPASSEIIWENCDFIIGGTGASGVISFNTSTGSPFVQWRNCRIKFGATGNSITIGGNASYEFHWQGGSIISGTSTPSATNGIFVTGNAGTSSVLVENVDLSNFGTSVNIHNGSTTNTGPHTFVIRNCKLPSGWNGNLVRQSVVGSQRYALYNCSAGAQNYKLWIECAEGKILDETTLVRANGATDGVTRIAWKLTASGNNVWPTNYLVTDDIVYFNSTTGAARTIKVQFLHDSATGLTNADIWLDVAYLGSTATPLGTFAPTCPADPLASSSTWATASAEPWTTTGMANPNKQEMSATFTPQMAGFYVVRVCLALASKVVYVDPKLEIT